MELLSLTNAIHAPDQVPVRQPTFEATPNKPEDHHRRVCNMHIILQAQAQAQAR